MHQLRMEKVIPQLHKQGPSISLYKGEERERGGEKERERERERERGGGGGGEVSNPFSAVHNSVRSPIS